MTNTMIRIRFKVDMINPKHKKVDINVMMILSYIILLPYDSHGCT